MKKILAILLALVLAVLAVSCEPDPTDAPTFSVADGVVESGTQVEISTVIKNGEIYYTLDGSYPSSSSFRYTSPIMITKNMVVKAVVYKDGNLVSMAGRAEYHVKATAPVASLDAGSYSYSDSKKTELSSTTPGSTIYYTTDGSDPATSSTRKAYSGSISVNRSMTLRAIAANSKYDNSEELTVNYGVKAAVPEFNPAAGNYDEGTEIAITCANAGVAIRYTTDGTEPTASSDLYTAPIALTRGMTIKAIAVSQAYETSDVGSAQYAVKALAPVANIEPGSYLLSQQVELTSSISGATIRYTTDGTTPTEQSSAYSAPITVDQTCSIKAVVFAEGYACSDVAEFSYEIGYKVGAIGPAGGYVFYDCDADNSSVNSGAGPDGLMSSACGWRYLEASPEDVTAGGKDVFVFGFNRPEGTNLFANGTTTYEAGTSDPEDGKCTGTAIGTGKANTQKLVEAMGEEAYAKENGTEKTSNYCAKLCDDYTYGGYDDWFMPSYDELYAMLNNLFSADSVMRNTGYYWSSSETSNTCVSSVIYGSNVNWSTQGIYRTGTCRVRAIRSFL